MKKILTEYIEYLKSTKKVSDNTVDSYSRDLYAFFTYLESKKISWDKLRKNNITAYLNYLKRNGKSDQTIVRNLSSIKGFYNYCVNNKKIKTNPVSGIKSLKVEKPLPGILTVSEVDRFLSQPDVKTKKGSRDKALLELLYATGIKVSQLIELRFRDIDLNAEIITCQAESNKRTIPYGSICSTAINDYIKLCTHTEYDDYLFTNLNGKKMSRQGLWKIIKHYASLAGINKEVGPQILRNSFAVHMINNGIDIKTLQELMGHSAITSTQIYENLNRNRIKEIYKSVHPRA